MLMEPRPGGNHRHECFNTVECQLSFITVVLDSVVELELPRSSATSMMINTAPPPTHTHGDVYHSVVVLVLVVVLVVT